MLIISDALQGSDEWLKERSGKITASNFSSIVTSRGVITSGETRKKYLYQLAGERISGEPEETFKTSWMERGNELEGDARTMFEEKSGSFITQVGMVYLDDRKCISCSPDGIIDESTGLEIKCPKLSTHIGYLDSGKVPSTYIPQIQGSMMVTGFRSWVFVSYHPRVKPLIITVERDDKYISILREAVESFNDEVETIVNKLRMI